MMACPVASQDARDEAVEALAALNALLIAGGDLAGVNRQGLYFLINLVLERLR